MVEDLHHRKCNHIETIHPERHSSLKVVHYIKNGNRCYLLVRQHVQVAFVTIIPLHTREHKLPCNLFTTRKHLLHQRSKIDFKGLIEMILNILSV